MLGCFHEELADQELHRKVLARRGERARAIGVDVEKNVWLRLASGHGQEYYLFNFYSPRKESVRQPLDNHVVRLLALEPLGLAAPELQRRLNSKISQPTLWRLLDRLRSEGRVTVVGRGRATRYHLAELADLPALRSRELHQHVARRLARDPSLRAVARERLRKLREVNPHGSVYHDRWAALLEGPLTRLLGTLTEVSEQADALRKESPFTPLVTAEERRRVFESTRAA